MIRTPVCDLLDIEHPIALGGMGSATSPELVAAVSKAGGLGALGCHYLTPEQIEQRAGAIRRETNKPFGLNFLVFDTREDSFAAALKLRPAVMQFAWPKPEQDLKALFDRAHDGRQQGDAHGGLGAGGGARRKSRRRHHHRAGHRRRRSRRLHGQHAADPDDRRRGCAGPGAGGGRVCRRAGARRSACARRAGHPARHAVSRHRGIAAASRTSSRRSSTATATTRSFR